PLIPRIHWGSIPAPIASLSRRDRLAGGVIVAPPAAWGVSMDESLFASQLEKFRRIERSMRNIAWRLHRQPLNQLSRPLWEDVYFTALAELRILRPSGSP